MLTDVKDILEFAEWRDNNRWFHFDIEANKWRYTFEWGTAISKTQYEKNYMKTTAEPTELFLKDKEKNLANNKS